jgi:hypothetical protein
MRNRNSPLVDADVNDDDCVAVDDVIDVVVVDEADELAGIGEVVVVDAVVVCDDGAAVDCASLLSTSLNQRSTLQRM